jgi:hypothetical protein
MVPYTHIYTHTCIHTQEKAVNALHQEESRSEPRKAVLTTSQQYLVSISFGTIRGATRHNHSVERMANGMACKGRDTSENGGVVVLRLALSVSCACGSRLGLTEILFPLLVGTGTILC